MVLLVSLVVSVHNYQLHNVRLGTHLMVFLIKMADASCSPAIVSESSNSIVQQRFDADFALYKPVGKLLNNHHKFESSEVLDTMIYSLRCLLLLVQ